MINEDIAQEILHELFSSLEAVETQSAAILQFLKDKELASDEELAVYFEQAGNASNVKWRAVRVRIDHLLSSAIKAAQESRTPEPPASSKSDQKPRPGKTTNQKADAEAPSKKATGKVAQPTEQVVAGGKSDRKEERPSKANNENDRNHPKDRSHNTQPAATSDSSAKGPSKKTA